MVWQRGASGNDVIYISGNEREGPSIILLAFVRYPGLDLFHYFAAFRFQSLLRFVIISKAGDGLICSLIISFLNNLLRVPFFFYSLGREGTGAGPEHQGLITIVSLRSSPISHALDALKVFIIEIFATEMKEFRWTINRGSPKSGQNKTATALG